MNNGNGANSECCAHVFMCFFMLMSEISAYKEIDLNGSAYISCIKYLAPILLTILCSPKFICWSADFQCGGV